MGSTTLMNSSTLGNSQLFVAKLDPSGNALWSNSNPGPYGSSGYGIALDNNDNTYVTGIYYDSVLTFGSYTLIRAGLLGSDLFVFKFDTLGNALWGKTAGGMNSDIGNAIEVDTLNNVYVTGFYGSNDCLFDTILISATDSWGDIFVAKLYSSNSVGFEQIIKKNDFISIYPNPASNSLYLNFKETDVEVTVVLRDMIGKEVFKTQQQKTTAEMTLDIAAVANGNYILDISTSTGLHVTKKLSIVK
jgi:hypothetical protein